MRRRVLLLAAVVALISVWGASASVAATPRAPSKPTARLKAFNSCSELVRYGNRFAGRAVGSRPPPPEFEPFPEQTGQPRRGAAPAPQGSAPADEHSTTNVQEAGVDEPDIVKSDGARILAIAGGKLHLVDVRGASPRLRGSLALREGWDHQLLVHGDRALVSWMESPESDPPPSGRTARSMAVGSNPVTVLAEVDIADPAYMRIVQTLTVEGEFVSARLTGRTARVVISASPRAIEMTMPAGPRPRGRRAPPRRGSPRVSDWVPRYAVRNLRPRRTVKRALASCRAVRHPPVYSGLDMLTVLTIDLAKGLTPVDSDALLTGADTVYASSGSLYTATPRWLSPAESSESDRPPAGPGTGIHKFDISQPDRTEYRASGQVRGFLLSQWSLSEHRGVLRVASTDEPSWWPEDQRRDSESFVTTLTERGGNLVGLGRVGGLGRGERIYAVRFIDDVGYVVTFRETDPLYTVDLAEPTRPRVLGELKILGYSAYLHPAGPDLLIGVGQDATEDGRRLGAQLSLFDVSDLRRPARLHSQQIGSGSWSEVEDDHHAFLYWPPAALAVLPVEVWSDEPDAEESGGSRLESRQSFFGAVGYRIDRTGGIAEAGRISHGEDDDRGVVRRSLVAQGRLYTISERGIKQSSLDTLAETGWLAFR